MRIGINMAGTQSGSVGAEEVFLRTFISRVPTLRPDLELVVFSDTSNHASFDGRNAVCLGDPGRAVSSVASAARKANVDVLISSAWTAPAKAAMRVVPIVLSLYGVEKPPEGRLSWFRRDPHAGLRHTLLSAPIVIVASEFLRRELLSLFEVPINRVVVAPPGVSDEFGQSHATIADEPYILFVGTTTANKNIHRVIDVFSKVREEFPHSLVVVGKIGEAEPDDWGDRVIRVEHVPVATLAGLYQHCATFLYPVLYDGSGLTVLEAMRAGAPIVTGRAGAIPEVAGDVPMYSNAESSGALLGMVRRVLTEPNADLERRIQRGRKLAGEFTWDKCLWKTLAALKREG